MLSALKYSGAPLACCGLLLLFVAATSCDSFRHSPCVDEPMQTGCQVTLSVSPGRIRRSEATSLALSFKEAGIGQLLAGLQDPPRVMLEQGEKSVPLSSPIFGPDGSMKVSISDAQAQNLSIGEAKLRLATDGGSAAARVEIYVEPKLIQTYVDAGSGIRKWAGLRGSPGKIDLFEQNAGANVGRFVEYSLVVDPNLPSESKPGLPLVLTGDWPFSRQPRVSNTQHYFIDSLQIYRTNGSTLGSIGSIAALDAAIYVDPVSDLISFVAANGLVIYADAGTSMPRASTAPKLLGVQKLTAADIDHDGHRDVLAWANESGSPAGWALRILLQQGDGSFAEETVSGKSLTNRINTLGAISALSTGDMDGDGSIDLLVATANNVQWLPLNGSQAPTVLDGVQVANLVAMEAADLDGDGLSDLAAVTRSGFVLYLNTALR